MVILSDSGKACTHRKMDGRRARWLLMCHDRVDRDEFLTPEFMADLLGVRRAGISVAAKQLLNEGSIDYHQGQFRILNRRGLEEKTCECYPIVKEEFDGLYREAG